MALLLIVGGIVAYFALGDTDGGEPAGTATTVQQTQTETVTTAETETETETETIPQEVVAMPDVRGAEFHDAVEQLVDAGLLPDTYPVESAEERGNVVEQASTSRSARANARSRTCPTSSGSRRLRRSRPARGPASRAGWSPAESRSGL